MQSRNWSHVVWLVERIIHLSSRDSHSLGFLQTEPGCPPAAVASVNAAAAPRRGAQRTKQAEGKGSFRRRCSG
ncbi:hypothetical protein OJAV_G00158390 [Oryzias javanicus]|uniref:Uncharacterized protein n=1 Tax=Oryzias javanicus TaxID=123683 RepID=A0A437CIS3_ORYJA|nr:hypothetical protein OJAV_G00158390 [Oryzias javanicus]